MNVYAESSAVLAWLLGEDTASGVAQALAAADRVIVSELTLIECDRVLIRGVALGEMTEAERVERRARLRAVAAHWRILAIGPDVVSRAREPFPAEPIRSLDAIHLASALLARSAIAGLDMLSLDERVRNAAKQLGMTVRPE